MSMSYQTRFLLARLQTSVGVAAAYDGADLIPCLELTHSPLQADRQERNLVDGRGGAKAAYLTRKRATVEAVVEAAGSGVVGTAPVYEPLIRACGWRKTVTAGVSVAYTPVTAPSLLDRATLVGGFGGAQAAPGVATDMIQELIDAVGTLRFSATENQLPRFTASMTAVYAEPVARSTVVANGPLDVGALVAAGYEETTEVNYLQTAFTFAGQTLRLREFSFTDQSPVIFIDRPNDIGTRRGVRRITGRLVVTAPSLTAYNYIRQSVLGATQALSFRHRTTAGQIVEITAPAVQAFFAEHGDDQDEVTATLDLGFLPVTGDDEITITCR